MTDQRTMTNQEWLVEFIGDTKRQLDYVESQARIGHVKEAYEQLCRVDFYLDMARRFGVLAQREPHKTTTAKEAMDATDQPLFSIPPPPEHLTLREKILELLRG